MICLDHVMFLGVVFEFWAFNNIFNLFLFLKALFHCKYCYLYIL